MKNNKNKNKILLQSGMPEIMTYLKTQSTSQKKARKKDLKVFIKQAEHQERNRHRKNKKEKYLSDLTGKTLIAEITGLNAMGDLIARPIESEKSDTIPDITIIKDHLKPASGVGDIVQIRLITRTNQTYEGEIIHRASVGTSQILGVYADGFIFSLNRRIKWQFYLNQEHNKNLKEGDLIIADLLPTVGSDPKAVFRKKIGSIEDPFAPTIMAIAAHKLPVDFSDETLKEAQNLTIPGTDEKRIDLTAIPFVTIDGETARDFDDAVWAEPDSNPENKDGWHVMIAISDVAYYVRPGSSLDKEARLRGNSVYFPDRVIPMLPFELSNGVCSLNPNEKRAALVLEAWIDQNGYKRRHLFHRALICSQKRLTYDRVQKILDQEQEEPDLIPLVNALNGAFQSLLKQRLNRGVLELNVPEYEIFLDDKGHVKKIIPRPQLDSMKLIEEFMILANVAAAETLEEKRMPVMYRVHEPPPAEKVKALNLFLKTLDHRTHVKPGAEANAYNTIIKHFQGKAENFAVNEAVLRAQAQAYYAPENEGHFGLALLRYAHFTSPIRRYADILVHRALIRALSLGPGGLSTQEESQFYDMAEHISATERQAAAAEQDASDRYIAAYLKNKIGTRFKGQIASLTSSGLFVRIAAFGTDGFIPKRLLTDDTYDYDDITHQFIGRNSGNSFKIGQLLDLMLKESIPLTGSMIFAPLQQCHKKNKQHKHKHKHKKK